MKIDYQTLEFTHLIEFTKDNTLLAVSHKNLCSVRIFLISKESWEVYLRQGRATYWAKLDKQDAQTIIDRVNIAKKSRIPLFKLKCSHFS